MIQIFGKYEHKNTELHNIWPKYNSQSFVYVSYIIKQQKSDFKCQQVIDYLFKKQWSNAMLDSS